jgi:PAS domain S-box-containing protein
LTRKQLKMDDKQQISINEKVPRQQLTDAQKTIRALQEELEETNKGLIALNLELELREEKFRSIFENALEGILSCSPDGTILSANPAAAGTLGYEIQDELVGRSVLQILATVEQKSTIFGKIEEKGYIKNVEVRLKGKDGRLIDALISGILYTGQIGSALRIEMIFTDITGRKCAELEIKKLNEELKHHIILLEAANKELEAFSYSVSHDLRAPLRAINGFSCILNEDYASQLSPEAKRYFGLVRSNTIHMGRLIDDLLSFSRLSRQPLKKQQVSLVDLIHQTLDDLRHEKEGRRVEITLGNLPACHGDPTLLKQVFINLLSNALKFTGKRETSLIEIGFCEKDGESVYYVKDNGVGFDMQYVHKLFGVFQRLHSTDEFEGTGVGLAIVQRIIHRHGGRVWAEGKVEEGATFYFTLPRERKE